MNQQQENILENYKNPQNYGLASFKVTNKAKAYNQVCGDKIEVFLNVENSKIKEISFRAEGCSISIGSMSMLSVELKGMKISDIKKYSYKNLKDLIGIELTPLRIKCAILGLEAVKDALF